MANPPNISIFDYSDPSLVIFNDAEGPSEILNNRLVSFTWKGYSDELIRMFWRDLHQVDPKGAINIRQTMDLIDSQVDSGNPEIIKFAKLMNTFKNQGSPIANPSPVYVTIDEYRQLQKEHDVALKTLWPRLRSVLEEILIFDLPDPDANVNEIRQCLNNNKQSLESIETLDLSRLGLTLIPPELKLCTGVTELDLADNCLTNISPLEGLTKLVDLDLSSNRLTDVSPLKRLTELSELSLSFNHLTDISPLKGLVNLKVLGLIYNQLKDISPLSGLVNLEVLGLSLNLITDVSPLKNLKTLRTLYLNSNQLTDISPLEGLVNLTILTLSYNQLAKGSLFAGLANLTVISGFSNLKRLALNHNELTDISPLAYLPKLRKLNLSNNLITDASPLKPLKQTTIYLQDNPLQSTSLQESSSTSKRTSGTAFDN